MIIYITRHGQPWLSSMENNPDYPAGDPILTELGQTQARLLGERLRRIGFAGRIFASPYLRTMETGAIIATATGRPLYPEPAIREIAAWPDNLAVFQGQTVEELRERFPVVPADAALPYPWWGSELEDAAAVLGRIGPFIDALIARGGEDALLVGHGASVSALHRYLLANHPEVLARVGNNWNCGLSALRVHPRLEALWLSDTSHLPAELTTSNAKTLAEWQRERAVGVSAPANPPPHKAWDWTA
ncbi:MAG: histidine phosphatase family protein [Chloroflexi bacterium]|mgnify:CR=1 FL=1|nr:histidine phosphatase family protein [Chloroflexota bacterium]